MVYCSGKTPLLPVDLAELKKDISILMKSLAFKGRAGEAAQVVVQSAKTRQVILTGLGSKKEFHLAGLERAASTATRLGLAAGFKSFALPDKLPKMGISPSLYQQIAGRGSAWGTYRFRPFKSGQSRKAATRLIFCGAEIDRSAVRIANMHAQSLLETADLANMPGNTAPPVKIAHWAHSMADRRGLGCIILGRADLEKKRSGGILSVAQGSSEDPCMIILKHAGRNLREKPIVLAGKTVTFDTGGINLKPGKDMEWMKYDKGGGMAVLAAMQVIARMKVKTPVIGILAAAENMPGAAATRPGDIIRAYNGKTVEVLNTDAEGRLVLADALGLAAGYKPRAIVDIATLTGAVVYALGAAAAAILGNDDRLVKSLIKAGDQAGERLWQLPLFSEYREDMKSDFADISNLSKSGGAGTATAAAFLREFVPKGIPWAHIDIAGTAWLQSTKPYQEPGATLFGARLLAQWIVDQEQSGLLERG